MKQFSLSYLPATPRKRARTWSIWLAMLPYLYVAIWSFFEEHDKTKFVVHPHFLWEVLTAAPVTFLALVAIIAAILELIRWKERTYSQRALSALALVLASAMLALLIAVFYSMLVDPATIW